MPADDQPFWAARLMPRNRLVVARIEYLLNSHHPRRLYIETHVDSRQGQTAAIATAYSPYLPICFCSTRRQEAIIFRFPGEEIEKAGLAGLKLFP